MKFFNCFNIVLGAILIGIIAISCSIPIMLVVIPHIQEYNLTQSFLVYPQSERIFMDSAEIGGGTTRKSLYYWSDDNIQIIQQFYEEQSLTFLDSRDNHGEWFITRLQDQEYGVNEITIISNPALCDYRDHYTCATLTLIDVNQPEFIQTAVMTVSDFRRNDTPKDLTGLPNQGTLIIFTYTVADY